MDRETVDIISKIFDVKVSEAILLSSHKEIHYNSTRPVFKL